MGLSPHQIAIQKAQKLLGCNIYQHDLVRGHPPTQGRIILCNSLREIIRVFEDRQLEVHGKPKVYGYRELYHKYKGENSSGYINKAVPS